MYCTYQDREELEDDLYQEDDGDSDGSVVNSELEFHLYSQLHYSSNAGEIEEQVGEEAEGRESQQLELTEKTADVDRQQGHTGGSRAPSPDISKLWQHLKKKKKRVESNDKQKKEKYNPKNQRLSSSVFEEVIVIDSSPNVISISDDTDDDDDDDDDEESICALKNQGSKQPQTSTPAQQGTQKRKGNLGEPVVVDLSSSESDSGESESKSKSDSSSDSSDSSDSDGLENWMILGRGNQDGDHTISLNLSGGCDISADVEEARDGSWLVSDKDKEAQIYNKDKGARIGTPRLPNRYYTSKTVQCRNCNRPGHLSKNCPEPKKLSPCFLCGTPGHVTSQCPNKHCSNCGLPGHLYESCSERAYWQKQCHRCSMTGHFFDACPEIWRQYHMTTKKGPPVQQRGQDRGRTPAYCYNCSKKGHFGHACTRQRMFNRTYPTTPFITHYDSVHDIKGRQYRIKLKVKDLQKNGFVPTHPQTPITPGPPKKKQKVSDHKNNHKSSHTPQHKPSPNHIFFNDDHDFMAPNPKTNSHKKFKQPQSSGSVKPWKPKRPVPTSRDRPPKLILDESADFPRGGGKVASTEIKKKKRNWRRAKKNPSAPPEGHSGGGRPPWAGETHQSGSKPEKAKRNRKNKQRSIAEQKRTAPMYPTDENLFIIKQRKRRS